MKFTLSWLKDHIEIDLSAEEIADTLTMIGHEIEGVEDPAKAFEGFVVGEVVSCEKHPDADRLNVTMVDTGSEKLQVVCGAPNCRQGIKVVFAPSGSYVPGIDVTLKKANIRGVESNGMCCSEKELCLSDNHEGIIELPEDAVVGSPATDALGMNDPVLELSLTPNRGDCAGVRGLAWELAAAGHGRLKPLENEPVKGQFESPIGVELKLPEEKKHACPLFLGRMIKGVKNGPSPKWLQDQLRASGLRPISALVDITNYMCLGLCRPLHVFDADKLTGNIHVRLSKKGEELEALNDKSYTLDDGMTVVCDDSGVLGLGGIVGGVPSSCTEETVNVFVEAAYFDPTCTALTGRALQIDSDARYRFDRGIDPVFTHEGMELATRMIVDLCGGEPSDVVVAGEAPDITKTIDFNPEKTVKLGGVEIDLKTQAQILSDLGFTVEENSPESWLVTTPNWRHDIEGQADLVEEILRIYGYDRIPATSVVRDEEIMEPVLNEEQQRKADARRLLALRGLNESVTYSFITDELADLFGAKEAAALKLVNPISSEMTVMRPSILPSLIEAAKRNTDRNMPDNAMFEIGNVYFSPKYEDQVAHISGLRTGDAVPRHWESAQRPVDVFDVKSDVLAVLELCGMAADNVQITTDAPDYYHPGRSGAIRLGKNVLAYFGELHPAVLAEMDGDFAACGFEIFVGNIPVPKKKTAKRKALHLSPYQPVKRDFAFVVDAGIAADAVLRAAKGGDKVLITDGEVFDVYTGKGVEEGKKSLAVSVTLTPTERTLTDEDIESVSSKVIASVEKHTGGVLRR